MQRELCVLDETRKRDVVVPLTLLPRRFHWTVTSRNILCHTNLT